MSVKVCVFFSSPILSVWRGGSLLASSPDFEAMCVTKAEYEELGSARCRRRFFHWVLTMVKTMRSDWTSRQTECYFLASWTILANGLLRGSSMLVLQYKKLRNTSELRELFSVDGKHSEEQLQIHDINFYWERVQLMERLNLALSLLLAEPP